MSTLAGPSQRGSRARGRRHSWRRLGLALLVLTSGCERAADGPPAAVPPPTLPSAAAASAPTTSGAPSAPTTSAAPTASAAPGAATSSPAASASVGASDNADAGVSATVPARDPRLPGKLRDGSGSNAKKSRDGKLFIAGQDRRARHTHGGEPAQIGNVSFVITNDSNRVRRITGKRADFLRDHGCEAPASTVVSHPKLESLVFEDDDDPRVETLTLEIPPGTSRAVRVGFTTVNAYYAWCDRFAIRVHFSVDGGEMLAPISELAVMRVEPLDRSIAE